MRPRNCRPAKLHVILLPVPGANAGSNPSISKDIYTGPLPICCRTSSIKGTRDLCQQSLARTSLKPCKSFYVKNVFICCTQQQEDSWSPFLQRPGNLTGPKSYFEIKVSNKVGCVLTSDEVHFVSLADKFTVWFLNLLKLPSGVENKTAYWARLLPRTSRNGPLVPWSVLN